MGGFQVRLDRPFVLPEDPPGVCFGLHLVVMDGCADVHQPAPGGLEPAEDGRLTPSGPDLEEDGPVDKGEKMTEAWRTCAYQGQGDDPEDLHHKLWLEAAALAAENGWRTPADDPLLPKGVTRSSVMQCYVCARDSRLNDPEGNQRHDETRQYAITDDMAGKIRLLARETLTHAIAAQLSGEDLQGQFRSKLDDLVEGDRQALRIMCDFMLSWCKSISRVVHWTCHAPYSIVHWHSESTLRDVT